MCQEGSQEKHIKVSYLTPCKLFILFLPQRNSYSSHKYRGNVILNAFHSLSLVCIIPVFVHLYNSCVTVVQKFNANLDDVDGRNIAKKYIIEMTVELCRQEMGAVSHPCLWKSLYYEENLAVYAAIPIYLQYLP